MIEDIPMNTKKSKMEEQKYSSIDNSFISIPYCNYVTGNIDIEDYQFLNNHLEETNQNDIIIRIQDITSVQIVRSERCLNKGWKPFYWMAFSLRNGHIVFCCIENNNDAKKMEGIVRKYISDSFRCQIKKEDI